MKKRIRFIVNPISGTGRQKIIEQLVPQKLNTSLFDYEIIYTKAPKHATELSKEAVAKKTDIVVAVGGDGAVNETGKGLIGSNTALAIIPAGSGNGLARHLKIPLELSKAIEVINTLQYATIDTVNINEGVFFNIAGVGLDAHISWEFAKLKKRGFRSYLKLFLKELPTYKAKNYELIIDGKTINRKALIISFANASQYGNNAVIAPQADLQDGYIDICILKKIPLYALPLLAYRLFSGTIHRSGHLEIIRGKEIILKQESSEAHIDGEPFEAGKIIHIKVNPLSLKVIVP